MLKNYFTVALRNLLKNRIYSLINIFGLALGLTCCICIALYTLDEFSYDSFHTKADRIYRLTTERIEPTRKEKFKLANTTPAIAHIFQHQFPEVEHIGRMRNYRMLFYVGEFKSFQDEIYVSDRSIFNIFDVEWVSGNKESIFTDSTDIVLSETMAKKYFGQSNPVGQIIQWRYSYDGTMKTLDMRVKAVYKDFPKNSHFHPAAFVNMTIFELESAGLYTKYKLSQAWSDHSFYTYFSLKKDAQAHTIEAKLPDFVNKFVQVPDEEQLKLGVKSSHYVLHIQKLKDIRLFSKLDTEISANANGEISTIYLYLIINFFILITACINFINLSTARASNRAKEVGIRKVVGAQRYSLIYQFLGETLIITLLAFILAFSFAELVLPMFNAFTDKSLHLSALFSNIYYFFGLLLFIVFVSLLSGLYPAWVLSSFQPIQVLKGKWMGNPKGKTLRTVLVISQFAIATIMVVGTLVTYYQLNFMRNKSLGYNKEHLINLRYYSELKRNFDKFKADLIDKNIITNVTHSSRIPSDRLLDNMSYTLKPNTEKNKDKSEFILRSLSVGDDFFETYQIPLAAGRHFEKGQAFDTNSVVVNEKTLEIFGFSCAEDAIGKTVYVSCCMMENRPFTIIGVKKNIVFESINQEVVPLVVHYKDKEASMAITVKIDGNNHLDAIRHLEAVWAKYLPERPFEFKFLDEKIEKTFVDYEKNFTLICILSYLSLIIACLGLFGLVSFITQQRTKEIGIRKVLGADMSNIMALLLKDFLQLLLVANLIALPLSYFFIDSWLQSFIVHIILWKYWPLFIASGMFTLLMACLTVSYKIFRVAGINPVWILRNE